MPKVKRSRKPPPDGWELIEPTLDELDQKMREGKPINNCSVAPHFAPGPLFVMAGANEPIQPSVCVFSLTVDAFLTSVSEEFFILVGDDSEVRNASHSFL